MRIFRKKLFLAMTTVITTASWSNDSFLKDSLLLESSQEPNSQYMPLRKKSKSTPMSSYETTIDLQKDEWIVVKDRDQLYSLSKRKNDRPCIMIDRSIKLTLVDMKAVEAWLKNPKVKYVVLDNRTEYNRDLDPLLLGNTLAVYPWYEDILLSKNSSLNKKEIYKLVWLPGKKVDEDLLHGMSSVPTDWLYEMCNYHLCYKIGRNLSRN